MEASTGPLIPPITPPQPNPQHLKQKLLKHGVQPTPKILHNLRKKHLQKTNRRLAKRTASNLPETLTDAQKQSIAEESHFQLIKSEYKKFTRNERLVGKPWEGLDRVRIRELASESNEYGGDRLNPQHLSELSDVIESERDKFAWILDDDVEIEQGWFENDGERWMPKRRNEGDAIKFLVNRLSGTELSAKDWKFTRMLRHLGLQFTEGQMLKIVEGLGNRGQWRHALSVVEWVYSSKEHRHYKSRFVYTKLLAVLGRARKPREALQVFNLMRGDAHIYPDMAAYHSVAVILGQGGLLKELVNIIETMKEKPKKIRNMRRKNWKPELQPDIVIFNAVLNACVATCQWKGVSWVFQQLRKCGLRPNGASYGLAMEVMLKAAKYDLVHELFGKMKRNGGALKALTYKVLVRAFWEEGKVNEAVEAVRDMERRGVIGAGSVYYELARCLCFYGRWQEAILEIENLVRLRPTRPLAVTFTGMIKSAMDGGHIHDCISIYEHSITVTDPDIGIINGMLKVYGRNDMFSKAKELFEKTSERNDLGSESDAHGHVCFPQPDEYTFSSMLEASASALQWEYFEYVYKEMTLSGRQLDQRKHSFLLVEASKAGKCHLLDHAFDSILEAGEVPPLSFFTEIAVQATIQRDYDRALNIINMMGHASFQVSFQDWINLFETNGDRIDQASISGLHEKLLSSDLIKEPTVLNLSRALEAICGSREDSLSTIVVSTAPSGDTAPRTNCAKESDGVPNGNDDRNGPAHPAHDNEHFDNDFVSSKISPSDSEDRDFEQIENEEGYSDADEFGFDLFFPSSEENDSSHQSDIPSAYEILETWKKR